MTQTDLNELKKLQNLNNLTRTELNIKLNYLMNQSIITINNQLIIDAKLNRLLKQDFDK